MKRDMDLIRKILLKLEDKESSFLGQLEIDDYEQEEISYQIALLHDADLVANLDELTHMGSKSDVYWVDRLTWEGHEFLDAARDDSRWEEAKQTMIEKTGGIAFTIFKDLLVAMARAAVFGQQ